MVNFMITQLFYRNTIPSQRLDGRTVCVTGSNTGLGLACAVHLARLNPARLILAVRNLEKGEKARQTVLDSKGVSLSPSAVEVWHLDLDSAKGVQAFADKCNNELERLDVLIENAGIATSKWNKTDDGFEQTIQVNDISTGLLAILLLPLLRKTSKLPSPDPASAALKVHLTIVSSEVHSWAKFNERKEPGSILAALSDEKVFKPNAQDRYQVSKLLNIYITNRLAKLTRDDDIIVNTVNPALCVSELRREFTGFLGWALDKLARTAEDGGSSIAWAGVSDTSATPGAYVSFCRVMPVEGLAAGSEAAELEERVWNELVEQWKKIPAARTVLEG